MKTIKKILLYISLIIIVIGMILLGKNGLRYAQGFTANILVDILKQYILYIGISTLLILIYLAIKYSKLGTLKVLAISILSIIGALALVIAIFTIANFYVSRIFISILLTTYVASIIILTAYFEEKTT